jgi:hypothetical protein
MITVDYKSDGGFSFPDGKCESWVNKQIKNDSLGTGDTYVSVGTSLLIDCFRVAIFEGRLHPKNIQFIFKGDVLFHDNEGRIADWPNGFADVGDHILERLLGWSDLSKNQKKEKNE